MQQINVVDLGPSADTCRRIIKETTLAILETLSARIKWPENENDCRKISTKFAKLAQPYGMPMVCGCVDGTLVNFLLIKRLFVCDLGEYQGPC
jgi:hypothetical protein